MSTDVVLSNEADGAHPEENIHLIYLKYSEKIIKFLENSVRAENNQSMTIYNILLDHNLHVWSTLKDKEDFRKAYEEKIVKLLQNPEVHYDKDQALIVCLVLNFKPGISYLCEKSKLYLPILHYHISQKDMDSAMKICRKFGNQEPRLWVEMLCNLPSSEHLSEVLDFIAIQKLLPSSLIVDYLTNSTNFTLKDVKKYLKNLVIDEANIRRAINGRNESEDITSPRMAGQILQCTVCFKPLKSPERHFQCSHSFHQNCLQSFSENCNECPACMPSNEKLFEILHNQSTTAPPKVTFRAHCQLEKTHDGISVVEYFERKVLKKTKISIDDDNPINKKPNSKVDGLNIDDSFSSVNNTVTPETSKSFKFGSGAEAKMRMKGSTSTKPESRRKGFKSFVNSQNYPQTSKAAPNPFEPDFPFGAKKPFKNVDDSHKNTIRSNHINFQIPDSTSKVRNMIINCLILSLLFLVFSIIKNQLESKPEPETLFSKIQTFFK